MSSVIDRINRAITTTGAVVDGITEDRLGIPTPCEGWDVRTELNHLVGGMHYYAAQLTGTRAEAAHEDDDWLGGDPRAAYAAAAEIDRAAWDRPDVLDGTVRLGFGTVPGPMAAVVHLTELLVHGTDLAIATGRPELIDEPACEQLLAQMRAIDFSPVRPPDMFGPELPAPADAPAHRRLLAFLGRALPDHWPAPAASA
jgi:uncharacterized protein (TIGR03086 family)